MCVQGCIVFWPGSAMVKDHPSEMMPTLPSEHCVQFVSKHLPEELRHLTMRQDCDASLHHPVLYLQNSKLDSSLFMDLY